MRAVRRECVGSLPWIRNDDEDNSDARFDSFQFNSFMLRTTVRVVDDSEEHTAATTTTTTTTWYDVTTETNLPAFVARLRRREENEENGGDGEEWNDESQQNLKMYTTRTRRRYTEFRALYDALTKSDGKYNARLPPMPGKTLSRTRAVAEARREAFSFVLEACARDYALRECEEFVGFLCGDDVAGGISGASNGGGSAAAAAAAAAVGGGTATAAREQEERRRRNAAADAARMEEEESWRRYDDSVALPPRENREGGLENLLASTMRVHGSAKAKEDSSKEMEARRPRDANDDIGVVVLAEEMVSAPTPSKGALAPSEDVNLTVTRLDGEKYEFSGRGAREAIKAKDAAGLERVLVEGGVDPNYKDNVSNTLLHLAAMFNVKDAVDVLLRRGADPEAQNAQGETPIAVAPVALSFFIKRHEALRRNG